MTIWLFNSDFLKMTRRAFLSSRVIRAQEKFDSNMLIKNWCKWIRKTKIFSESVNSFELGTIFPPRSGQELSRNVGAVSVYAFLKKLY